jgi:hypothetical protein
MAAEAMELADILSDKPAPKPEPGEVNDEAPPPEKPEGGEVERVQSRRQAHRAKEMEAQGRDPDTGKFVAKDKPEEKPAEKVAEPAAKEEPKAEEKKPEAKPAEAPKEELTPKERAAFAKAADETRKRQALEQELAKLRGAQPAAPATPAEKKTFWDDPEGALKAHEQRIAQRETQLVLTTTERIARSKYQDFDDKIAVFSEIVQAAPGLAQQWLGSADPAEFAYRTGKAHIELREAGGLESMRAKIEKETREKVEKEFRERADKEKAERAAIPPSISQIRGAATQHVEKWNGPPALSDILKS